MIRSIGEVVTVTIAIVVVLLCLSKRESVWSDTSAVVTATVAIHVSPLRGIVREGIANLLAELDHQSGVLFVRNGDVGEDVVVTNTISVFVAPLKWIVREGVGTCAIWLRNEITERVCMTVTVGIRTALHTILRALAIDIEALVTIGELHVVTKAVSILISPLEWLVWERILWIGEAIAIRIRTSTRCRGVGFAIGLRTDVGVSF